MHWLTRTTSNTGRQLMSAPVGRSCTARALTTDGRQPPLPTELADPAPPPPAEDVASATTQKPGPESLRSRLARRAGQQPGQTSPTALFTRHKKVEADEGIADNYQIQQGIAKTTGGMGSVLHERFDPSSLLRDPPRPEDVTLELLMASQTHMGHHTSLWNPANQRYIYGVRDNIHIISLEETAAALRRAARVVEEVAYLGGLILFVGNRRGQMEVVARAAELAGACHLFTKWVPGTITNRDQILGREPMRVVDERDKTLQGFDRLLIEKRPLLPDLVVVLNPLENFVMLHECAQETIPTIGLIDTDADPTRVTYTIPGNDDR